MMTVIRTFVELNREIISFAYGLMFFVLGLAIALQSRYYSRLDLARSLSWLAAFGFAHSLYEWGELFSPIQEAYLSLTGIEILHGLHLLMLGISLTCLFQFGLALLQPIGRRRWLLGLPTGILVVWFFVAFMVLPRLLPDHLTWHYTTEALGRYLIGFPGGLLAAYELRRQAFQRIAPLNVPHIVRTLRAAGIALALFAFFGGLIVPPVSFFPGNVLNSTTFEQVLGLPPSVFRALIGLALAVTFIRALEIFDVETARRIEAMEQQQILSAERDRIARELHDGVIQKVYTAGLIVQSAQNQTPSESPIASRLDKAVAVLNDAIRDLRQQLGELRAAPPDESFSIALRRLVEDPRFRSLVDISLDLDLPDADTLSPARADHVLAILTEALSNVVRHAHARRVNIRAQLNDGRLMLMVQDDGIGIPSDVETSYGLRNMQDRARLLGGQLEVSGMSGKGTTVQLDIPWTDGR